MKRSLREWLIRIVILMIGLTVAHLGVTLFLLTDLGSDPFNVFIQGLQRGISSVLPVVTHGWVHVGISFLIILILLIVDRSYIRIGTLLCMVLGGPIIDAFTLLLQDVIHAASPLPWRIACLALGCVILAFGMTIVIKSEAGTGPNDLVAVVISDKSKKKFGIIRIAVDVCFAAIGFVFGGTVGAGTVICAFLVGPTAQLFFPISEKFCKKMLKE